jgi:hypothetical protein
MKYYLYHALSWPSLLQVADVDGEIVGYVLAKLDEECKKRLKGTLPRCRCCERTESWDWRRR